MMAFVLGHQSDFATIPMPTSAASAAPTNAYVLARGFADDALMGARVFAVAAARAPGLGAASAIRPVGAEGARSGVGAIRFFWAAGAGAASPSPAAAGSTRLGPRTLGSTGPGPNCSGSEAAGSGAMPEV